MKLWNLPFCLLLAGALASCTKDRNELTTDDGVIGIRSVDDTISYTKWESGYNWERRDSASYQVYAHDRKTAELTPAILSGGYVAIWARYLVDEEGDIIVEPQLLPFHVLPKVGRPAFENYWYYLQQPGNVTVKFRTNKYLYTKDPVPLPTANAQFRYFFLPRSEMDRLGLNVTTISGLTYAQFLSRLGLSE